MIVITGTLTMAWASFYGAGNERLMSSPRRGGVKREVFLRVSANEKLTGIGIRPSARAGQKFPYLCVITNAKNRTF